MTTHFQQLLVEAARSETRDMAALRRAGVYLMPVDLEHCPRHPRKALAQNFVGLLVCPHEDCQPDRG
ncbi:hypothetical protein [Streptomyces sp. NPDC057002]|uniref:hypothetical protein n=1 Tax=Streptomyces sp. NPDC057002 TaxID=3345992 RepID=UPI00362E5F95